MTRLLARPRFEYGNTRLRARRLARLGAAQLVALAGRDADGLLAALTGTDLRPEADAAVARGGGARRLHEAIRAHEARELEQLRGFYEGPARELVDLLLVRFDLHNLLVLLRGVLRGAEAERTLLDVIPMGAFGGALAREIARQHEPAAATALLASWRLPDPATARATARAYEGYERDGDLGRLEGTIAAAHSARVAGELERFGDEAGDLRAALARRADDTNAVALARLRAALAGGELERLPEPGGWLPGGTIAADTLDAALRQPDAAQTAAALAAAAPHLGAPLAAWTRNGDLAGLQRALDRQRPLDEIGLLRRGDPLGIAVPIGYVAELELEARNLRVLAEAATLGLTADELAAQLLLPEARR